MKSRLIDHLTSSKLPNSHQSPHIIPLKLPWWTFMTISSMQLYHKKYHAFAFLISLLPFDLLLTPLRLNSCLSNSKTNSPKYTTLHLTPPTLLETLASPWRTSYFLWPNYSSLQSLLLSHSSTSLYPALPWFVNCLYHATSIVHSKLITVILTTINFLSLNYPSLINGLTDRREMRTVLAVKSLNS